MRPVYDLVSRGYVRGAFDGMVYKTVAVEPPKATEAEHVRPVLIPDEELAGVDD